jgi:multicomponent Na+:H+ antiporter subunit G
MREAIGVFFLLFGLFFCVMGVIGNIRLPDVFTRLHATGKVSSMGIIGLVVASSLLLPGSAPKAILLGILVFLSAPVASQAIARTAFRDGCVIVGLVQNDLAMQYIDFPYNYTIGEVVPWLKELEDEPAENFDAFDHAPEGVEQEGETAL